MRVFPENRVPTICDAQLSSTAWLLQEFNPPYQLLPDGMKENELSNILISQHTAALEMLRTVIQNMPESLWDSPEYEIPTGLRWIPR